MQRAALPQQQITVPDPLIHASGSRAAGASKAVLIAVAALIFHAVVLAVIAVASTFAAVRFDDRPANIEVGIVSREPPPPPKPPEPPPKPPEPEPQKEEKKPQKRAERPPPPPPDPIDEPPEKPKEEPKPADPQPVRRIVGLNLESTTSGGGGPSFATGNTRMGTTEKVATAPGEAPSIPKDVVEKPANTNRAATRIPVAGAKIVAPQRKKQIKPDYPERARQAGIEGDVVVRVNIDKNGRPTAVEIVKPAELEELNLAAKEAAMREEFTPATRDGVPIEYTLTYTYFFRLNG